MLPAFITA